MKQSLVDGWKVWKPACESEEARFCDLVCHECTKSHKNEGGYHIGCRVLFDAVNADGDQILFNEEKGSIECQQQNLKGWPDNYRCRETADLFVVSAA